MKRLALLMAVAAIALAVAAPAYAQTAVSDAYGGKGGGIVGTVNSGNGPSASGPQQVQASSGSSLPFTGLDVGLLALGGVALVGVGVGLRRFARPLS
jgi:hypothetical protein